MVPDFGICVSKQKIVENWRYNDGEYGAPACGSYHVHGVSRSEL